MTGRCLVNFKQWDVGFIEVAVVIFFGGWIEFLGYFYGDGDLFWHRDASEG